MIEVESSTQTTNSNDTTTTEQQNLSAAGGSNFEFISPTPIDKPNDTGERGTGYDYESDTILQGYEIPIYSDISIKSPFSFQVAGHDPFLKAIGGLLCKPSVPRELWFYLQLNKYPHYIPLVATFLGTVEFSTEEILKTVQSPDIKEDNITPWAEKVHEHHLKRINRSESTPNFHRYLVLKDMTFDCKRPCVMDLKLGKRAYGDDATQKKMISQTLKSKKTTSFKTGIRICGCQGYSVEKGDYWQLHKYEGRKITKETLPLAFRKFFHNDEVLRVDVIKLFIEKCKHIISVVTKDEFRFYSTSLLFVYEGIYEENPTVHLTMIDFAHTFPADGKEIDDGYLFGMQYLLDILETLVEEELRSKEEQSAN